MMVQRGRGKEETKAGERQSDGVIKWERVSTLWDLDQGSEISDHGLTLLNERRASQPNWNRNREQPISHPEPGQSGSRPSAPNGPVANPRPRTSHQPIRPPSGHPHFSIYFPMLSFSFILVVTIAAVPVPLWAWQLHHRVLHPSLPEPPFLNRASILSDAAGNLRIQPAPSLQADFESFVETAHVTDALYQLALDPHPGQSTSLWLTSSIKAVISFPSSLPTPPPHLSLPSATSSMLPTSTSSFMSLIPAALHSPLIIS